MSERADPFALVARAKELQVRRDVPGAVRAFMAAGVAYLFDYADIPSARQALTTAYQLDPQNLDVVYNMGRVDVVDGRVQEGLAKFIDVLRKSNVQHLPALFEAGCVYQSMNQYDQAMLAFKRILDRDSNHIDAMVRMAQLHEARDIQPDAIGYYVRAAEMAWDSKQFATARQLANHVLGKDPRNAKARYLIADLDEKGETENHPVEPEPRAVPAPDATRVVAPVARQPLVGVASERVAAASPTSVESSASGGVDAARQRTDADIAELTRQRAEVEAQLATERALIESAIRRKSQLHTELAQAQSAVGRAQSEALLAAERRRAELEAQVEEHAAALRDVQREVSGAQAALESFRLEHDALERSVAKLREEENETSASRDKARAEIEDLSRQLEELKAQVEMHEALGRQAVSSAGVWEERVRRLHDEVDELEGRAKYLRPRGSEATREKKTELSSRRTAEGR